MTTPQVVPAPQKRSSPCGNFETLRQKTHQFVTVM
jgi:hypothetical protein